MKIIFLLSNPGLGGIECQLSWIVPQLNGRGHEACIYNIRSQSQAHELWRELGVPFRVLPDGTPAGMPLVVGRLIRQLRRDRPDVVHIYGLRANLIGRIAAAFSGIPVVISGQVSTDDWRRWYHISADRLTSPLVSCYIANADAVRQAFLRREHLPPNRIVTIHDGIDVDRYPIVHERREQLRYKWGVEPGETVFLMIANVRPAKDHSGLLSAVQQLAKSESKFKVVLVGEDFTGGTLQADITGRGLESLVSYQGHQPDAGRLWAGADVALLCSHWEGFPFSLLEAMATGLPIIATQVGGVDELVADGTTGLVVPPRQPTSFCEAMRTLLVSPRLRKQMAEAGRERARHLFSLQTMVTRLEHLYQTALDVERGVCSPKAFHDRITP